MSDELKQWDKIIIGIDPGTNVMGYALLGVKGKTLGVLAMGVLRLNKFDDHYMRLHRIYERVAGPRCRCDDECHETEGENLQGIDGEEFRRLS